MDLSYFNQAFTQSYRQLSGGAITEVYVPPGRPMVVLMKLGSKGFLLSGGVMYRYESIAHASFALVQWDPLTQEAPAGFDRSDEVRVLLEESPVGETVPGIFGHIELT